MEEVYIIMAVFVVTILLTGMYMYKKKDTVLSCSDIGKMVSYTFNLSFSSTPTVAEYQQATGFCADQTGLDGSTVIPNNQKGGITLTLVGRICSVSGTDISVEWLYVSNPKISSRCNTQFYSASGYTWDKYTHMYNPQVLNKDGWISAVLGTCGKRPDNILAKNIPNTFKRNQLTFL